MPLFLTQGLTENNTVADGTAQYLDNHAGYERAWLGPWEHVRGNETDERRPPEDGPRGLLRRGHALLRPLPQGRRRRRCRTRRRRADQRRQVARASRPGRPPTRTGYTTHAADRHYTDDGSGTATELATPTASGRSRRALPYDAHLSGAGKAVVDVATTRPNANLVVDVYDLDEYGIGPLITRQGFLARSSGEKTLDLWSADWKLPAGPPDRRARDRRQRGLVDPHAAVRQRRGRRRLRDAAVPRQAAHGDDPGRPGHAARGLPGRDDHRPARDDARLGQPASPCRRRRRPRECGASQARSAGPSRSDAVLAWCQ